MSEQFEGGQNELEKSNKNKPIKEFRAGRIKASIWSNPHKEPDGTVHCSFSVTIVKSYKGDKDTGWKETNTFFPEELPKLQLVAQKAFEHLVLLDKVW